MNLISNEKELLAYLLSYRGQRPELLTLAHALRLGFGVTTPEDQAHFEAVLSSNPEHVARAMRDCAEKLSTTVKGGKS